MTIPVSPAFVCVVDWGTTSFRLWLLDREGAVLAESRSDEGMMKAAETGFAVVLQKHLAKVEAHPELPVLVCGMAGARQGWVEAPYVAVPATLAGLAQAAGKIEELPRDIRILPGVAQRDPDAPDVMRGEETQLLGLADIGAEQIICMPGTHSKWVEMREGAIHGFTTYMTGELFSVIGKHSILRHTVGDAKGGTEIPPAFLEAASRAMGNPDALTQGLFKLRAGQLLGYSEDGEGAAQLSGLLIGAEIGAALRQYRDMRAPVLISDGRLGLLYEAALKQAGLEPVIVDAGDITRAGLYTLARQIWAA
ncbi:2-dehydro-3-deoxygalactonokinase [Falsochrobactrum shanghaiense]|uniref:2-dehydro-3-deoxygalactonokinase n=1 Tax=Falsochrobactrum shanghaiense TaxID=2201899 RepID=A0A316JAR0_9HYPH|nr:2-dehydro-3-deoxygalactonokinase [Falsochrobactrum shanghaiense]PWL18962.1 2-dehydro-3-deoxygalactonokinase [Falsochrobactrum shanghaiense]